MSLDNKVIQSKNDKFVAKTQQIPYSPVAFEKGEGAVLFDHDGKKYIDFLSSACSANLGHGNKEIANAVRDQMYNITQYTFAYFNTEPPVLLAEELAKLPTGASDNKVLFSATGSAAIDSAIKISRGFTGRTKLISMIGAYHGSTFGALSLSALSINMRKSLGPLVPEVYHFRYPDSEHSWQECIDEMKDAFNHYLPADEVAAIFIEPVAGDMGLVIPPKEWLQELRNICDEHGILLVSDEIQLGLCRTGKWFALDNFDVKADLYVLGKSVGGGLPLGAVVGRQEVMDKLDAPAHVFTLAGNTTVCVAALKSLEILKRIDANKLSVEKGQYLERKIENLRERFPFVGEIRGLGLSIGVDIINPETKEKDPTATAKICYECFKRGLILIFINQSTLRVQPPLVIEYEQLDEGVKILEEVMEDFSNGKISDDVLSEIKGW